MCNRSGGVCEDVQQRAGLHQTRYEGYRKATKSCLCSDISFLNLSRSPFSYINTEESMEEAKCVIWIEFYSPIGI